MADSIFSLSDGTFDVSSVLNFIFGSSSSDAMFLKVGLWLVLFAVMFKAVEKTLSSATRAQAALLSLVISVLAIHFMPDGWLQMLGTFIWVIAFIVVPYFLISSLTQPGVFRWILVIAAYVGMLYSLANVGSLALSPEISSFVNPILDALAPVLYVVGDMLRLNANQYIYVIIGIVILIVVLALTRGRRTPGEESYGEEKRDEDRKPRESWLKKLFFGSAKIVGKTAEKSGRIMKEDWEKTKRDATKAKEYMQEKLAARQAKKEEEEKRRRQAREEEARRLKAENDKKGWKRPLAIKRPTSGESEWRR